MRTKLLLGLCGRARHGKDFVAAIVQRFFQNNGYACFTSSVSVEVLKDAQRLGLIRPEIGRAQCTRDELDVLVSHGHWGRTTHGEDFWILKLEARITDGGYEVAIVPGIRFPNEIAWLRRNGGMIARVKRYNTDGSVFISTDRDPNDPMETCIERVVADYEISATTGQEPWLEAQAEGLALHLFKGMREADKYDRK